MVNDGNKPWNPVVDQEKLCWAFKYPERLSTYAYKVWPQIFQTFFNGSEKINDKQ